MDLGLSGKRVAISGGSRGIGRAMARLFAEEGCDISICARGQEQIDAALDEFRGLGVRAMGTALQGRDGAAVRDWMQRTAEAFDGIDIVVANLSAGGGTDAERYWYRNFEIDLMSATRAVDGAVPHMKQAGGGSILAMATMAASETFVAPMAYNSVKAALITWSQQLSQKLAEHGIRVNCLSPGPTLFPGSNWEMIRVARSRIFDAAVRQQPTRRMGTAEEIARAAVFLASPAASWCQGAHLLVDGGFSKRVQF